MGSLRRRYWSRKVSRDASTATKSSLLCIGELGYNLSVRAIVTGSGGLIGSACVALLCREGWDVTGIDNDTRQTLFGPGGSTAAVVSTLQHRYSSYTHVVLDIRDRQ